MNTVVGEQRDFIVNSVMNGKPVEGAENGCDVFMFSHPHQDPGSAVLNMLELLKALARNPDEECVAVVEPGGDKGVDQLFCVLEGKEWAELGDIS